jgi:hypothetical protein
MKVLLETTDWAWPNHVYYVNDSRDKMYAYVRRDTQEVFEFKKPIQFRTSRRKFQEIDNYFGYIRKEDLILVKGEHKVTGSKGTVYTVTEEPGGVWSCSCVGFKYHSECKHIRQLNSNTVS